MAFSNFQNHFSSSPFSDSYSSKLRVKTWGEEIHAITTKFRNKLFLFHYRKIATAQNYERI